MYDIKQIFANNIKRIRKNRKLTQEQFAEAIGMQWKSVVNFESGRNLANSENLKKICSKLNITPAELFLTFDDKSDIKEKINIILNKANKNQLEEIYRIVAVVVDKTHFNE